MVIVFKIIIVFTVIQRLSELVLAKRNEKFILSEGGKIIPEVNYIFMVLLHTLWLVAMVYLTFMTDSLKPSLPLFIGAGVFFIFGQFLRITAIKTLGKRWSTRIVILPEAPAVNSGIFKLFRHPNYLGVVIEIAALPLMMGLYNIAILFSFLNFVILYFRIQKEEEYLSEFNNYSEIFNLK